MEKENAKIVRLLEFVLNFYGIYPFAENVGAFRRNWLLVYSYVAYVTMIIGNICLMIFHQDLVSLINALSVIIGSIYFLLVQFLSASKSVHLRRLLVAFGSHDQPWSTFAQSFGIEEQKIATSRMFCIHSCIAAYNIVSYAMVMLFPFFAVWFLQIAEMGEPSSLIFPCWYPWDVKDVRWYFVTYVIQIANGVLFQIILYTTTTFNAIVLCVFRNDFHELQLVIRGLSRAESGEKFVDHLERCVKRHQTLLSSFNEYKSWFNVLYASELTYYTLEFLLLGSMAFSNTHDIIFQARNILILFNITMFLYIHCWIGESFYSLNGTLSEALYSLPWFTNNFVKVRKSIHIFIDQTQHPLCLTAFDMFHASLQVFFGILRSSYGYLSLLLATLK